MKNIKPYWKDEFTHWLVNNLQLTSKSNVELIVKHVEHYYIDESDPSEPLIAELIRLYNKHGEESTRLVLEAYKKAKEVTD